MINEEGGSDWLRGANNRRVACMRRAHPRPSSQQLRWAGDTAHEWCAELSAALDGSNMDAGACDSIAGIASGGLLHVAERVCGWTVGQAACAVAASRKGSRASCPIAFDLHGDSE